MTHQLILKRASASRPSGEWNDDDFDVLADGAVVVRIMKVHAAPVGTPWMWTLAFWHHEDRTSGLLVELRREVTHERAYRLQDFLGPVWRVSLFGVHRRVSPCAAHVVYRRRHLGIELFVRRSCAGCFDRSGQRVVDFP
jgi:hypothetical protein